jgi:hypothetical protein
MGIDQNVIGRHHDVIDWYLRLGRGTRQPGHGKDISWPKQECQYLSKEYFIT